MVWTTCMLFFQVVLVTGYSYAYILARLELKQQFIVHLILLCAAIALLPITPDSSWKPTDSENPTTRILLLLLVHVGLPYFMLSSTAPLIQSWYSKFCPGKQTYRLYALSNFGSLLALLSYPFLVETNFDSPSQGQLWSYLFWFLVFIFINLIFQLWRTKNSGPAKAEHLQVLSENNTKASDDSTGLQKLMWILLPAWASMLLLTFTNFICQDIAVIPFLWVVPLSIYLLTFIISFDHARWYHRGIFSWITVFLIVSVSLFVVGQEWQILERLEIELPELEYDFVLEGITYLIILFTSCMLCHGELVRLKPRPEFLTSFYLMIATGGAVGGLLVAVIFPQLFSTFYEIKLGLVGCFLIPVFLILKPLRNKWGFGILLLLLIPSGFLVLKANFGTFNPDIIVSKRNFYGVLHVEEKSKDNQNHHRRELYHGRVMHGFQLLEPIKKFMPTSYYVDKSGLGKLMQYYPRDNPLRIGVIGLGVGTISVYGEKGDYFRYYEINPQVIEIAKQQFSYLENSHAELDIILGDARLSMENEANQSFDIVVIDAFSGDSIPIHLLTLEAFETYRRHLKENGVIAAHITNRHLDLRPVIQDIADEFNMTTLTIVREDSGKLTEEYSEWMLLSDDNEFLMHKKLQERAYDEEIKENKRVWTDNYNNLFEIFYF